MNKILAPGVIWIVAMALLDAGCSSASTTIPTQDVVAGNTAFALDLYQREKKGDANLFFSPYSISAALAMTYTGARDGTAEEFARVLHFPSSPDELARAYAGLTQRFDAIAAQRQIQLSVANSLWCERAYHFLEAFLKVNREDYGAEIRSVDFVGQPDAARMDINTWIAQKTLDKIRDLLRPGQVTSETRLVLCNAIYFKGNWLSQFDPKATTPQPFFLAPGRSVNVPMMSRKMNLRWHALDDFTILELPYTGKALSMIILLPKAEDGLGALESRLQASALREWLAALSGSSESEAVISLPKFKLNCRLDLSSDLAGMGMASAFGSGADFSGMTGSRNLFISSVVHQAFIDVNEEGTEAAAATAVTVMRSAMIRPNILRIDHPFLFLIVERETNSILFLGRVSDPSQ